MKTVRPQSWDELNRALLRNSYDNTSGKWRTYTAFRGVPRDYGNMFTRLRRLEYDRNSTSGKPGSLEWKERRLLDNFLMYERLELRSGTSIWDVMVLGQHHWLPTRLLDWTSSPLVALFFTAENFNDHDKDGVVWCVERIKVTRVLPDELQKLLENSKTNLFSLKGLSEAYPQLCEFDELDHNSPLFFEPPSVSPRIVQQFAFFSVMPGAHTHILPWLEKHPTLCWKVIVPAALKKEIRERLMILNVSERTLYPGLDGTCQWLEAWYR